MNKCPHRLNERVRGEYQHQLGFDMPWRCAVRSGGGGCHNRNEYLPVSAMESYRPKEDCVWFQRARAEAAEKERDAWRKDTDSLASAAHNALRGYEVAWPGTQGWPHTCGLLREAIAAHETLKEAK